jgi:hypothetical protein
VIVVARHDQHMPEIGKRYVDEAVDAPALIGAVFVDEQWIQTPRVTKVACDDQDISLRQAAPKFLGLKMQVAHVVAAHAGPHPNRRGTALIDCAPLSVKAR